MWSSSRIRNSTPLNCEISKRVFNGNSRQSKQSRKINGGPPVDGVIWLPPHKRRKWVRKDLQSNTKWGAMIGYEWPRATWTDILMLMMTRTGGFPIQENLPQVPRPASSSYRSNPHFLLLRHQPPLTYINKSHSKQAVHMLNLQSNFLRLYFCFFSSVRPFESP